MVTWRIESGPLSKVGKTAINVVSRIFPTLLFLSLIFVGFRIDKNDPKIFVAYVALAVNTVILLANIWHSAVRHERQINEYAGKFEQLIKEHDRERRKYERRARVLERKARYAEAMLCIHHAVHQSRDATWYLEQCGRKEAVYHAAALRELLKPCMDAVVQALAVVTGTPNRACIKLLGGKKDDDNLLKHVRTLCRDSVSAELNKKRDAEEENLHKVGQNTAYRNILRDGEPYFFSNDLPSGKFYENTSKKLWANGALPYKATIVFPIQHVRSAKGAGAIQQSTRGFLCVDASIINTYRGGYDTELVAIVADALFPVLEELQALQDNERAEQQASLAAASG